MLCDRIRRGHPVTTIPAPMFSFPLADDAVLIPRTAAIPDAYHELVAENTERLAQWEPWTGKPPVLEETRSFLEASGRNWGRFGTAGRHRGQSQRPLAPGRRAEPDHEPLHAQ